MAYLLNIFVILFLSLLSLSFLPNLSLFNTVPLLPLFFIIGLTYFRKGVEPILLAALAGVLLDFFSAYGFGLYLSVFLGIAIGVRVFFQEGMKELSVTAFVAMATAGLLLCYSLQVFMLYLADVNLDFISLGSRFLPFILINMVFVLIAYPLEVWYFERIKNIDNYQKRR